MSVEDGAVTAVGLTELHPKGGENMLVKPEAIFLRVARPIRW